jgi:hypothetical protein
MTNSMSVDTHAPSTLAKGREDFIGPAGFQGTMGIFRHTIVHLGRDGA